MTSALLILIVDERHDEAFGCEQLREAGYCVVHARAAAAAHSLVEQDEPDLIVAVDRAGREFVGSLENKRSLLDCPLIMIGECDSDLRRCSSGSPFPRHGCCWRFGTWDSHPFNIPKRISTARRN